MDGITWEQFLNDIKIIHDISHQLNDDWRIVCANDEVTGTYLVKTKTISLPADDAPELIKEENGDFDEDVGSELFPDVGLSFESPSEISPTDSIKQQLIKFEYHVLYHISYAVPYLCFNAYKSNGTLLTLDEAWKVFNDSISLASSQIKQNMLNILTQMDHFRPFLTLHPCRIAEVLHSLPNSQNKVLSFLSVYGPTVHLTFDLEYAKCLDKIQNNKELNL